MKKQKLFSKVFIGLFVMACSSSALAQGICGPILPIQHDCKSFLIPTCDGYYIKETCPGGLAYNPATEVCDYETQVDCSLSDTPVPVRYYENRHKSEMSSSSNTIATVSAGGQTVFVKVDASVEHGVTVGYKSPCCAIGGSNCTTEWPLCVDR